MIAVKYALFAVVATGVNLLTQWPVFAFFEGFWVLYAALACGTMAGLVTKYLLDKRWIFYYIPRGHMDNLSRFGLYSLMGGVTTMIFCGTEMGFYYFFQFAGAQYIGGALGLTVGYMTKYVLDKKFVFRRHFPAAAV